MKVDYQILLKSLPRTLLVGFDPGQKAKFLLWRVFWFTDCGLKSNFTASSYFCNILLCMEFPTFLWSIQMSRVISRQTCLTPYTRTALSCCTCDLWFNRAHDWYHKRFLFCKMQTHTVN